MGIAISVDDFGTGYSSLSYLRRLPLSTLKIDRAFVQDVTSSPDAAAIADIIIAMAHRLNLSVIAEGVEEEAQLQFLRDKGCEMMQGYYFSKPIPADAFTELLRTGRRLASPPDLFSCMTAKT
jgi:EAL domain-containing protein (putative c-di-GMP-specific phosphodiesterase class I)